MIFSSPTFRNLRFEPNRMDLVLYSPKWMLSLLSRNHSHSLLKSLFKCFSILVACLRWKTRQDSSAYSYRSEDTACFISLTYIRKSKGPRIDPWGRPHEIFEMLEYLFSMLKMPDQSNMNETNLQYRHKNQLPLIFPKVYYGRSYQTPFEDLSVSYQ